MTAENQSRKIVRRALVCSKALSDAPESILPHLHLYLERRINDGSPSGYGVRLPEPYSPLGSASFFKLPFYRFPRDEVLQVGVAPITPYDNGGETDDRFLPWHPLSPARALARSFSTAQPLFIPAVPTSSGRTVLCFNADLSEPKFFVKLHVPLEIGRFSRALNLPQWIAGLENSRLLLSLLPVLPQSFGVLHEFAGVYLENIRGERGAGAIYRDYRASPILAKKRLLLVPAFSLFAKNHSESSGSLLKAIIDLVEGADPQTVFVEKLIAPLVESFFTLSASFGLIPEWNAQNVLFELDLDGHDVRAIVRDHGDIFKDIALRQDRGLTIALSSYKSIYPDVDADLFQRRSFAFDFKLGEYTLMPMCREFSVAFGVPLRSIIQAVKGVVRLSLQRFPWFFKNDTVWYRYPRRRGVSRHGYLEETAPRFR